MNKDRCKEVHEIDVINKMNKAMKLKDEKELKLIK